MEQSKPLAEDGHNSAWSIILVIIASDAISAHENDAMHGESDVLLTSFDWVTVSYIY